MEKEKSIRKPKQVRSIHTKEKILDTALQLFCEKGYYKTTTNQIAEKAQISIGSLYSYFKDKDTIFLEILGRYNQLFLKVHAAWAEDKERLKADKKEWLRQLITGMIKVHEVTKELNREIKILCFTKPEVAEILEKQRIKTKEQTREYFRLFKDEIKVEDVEAAAIVMFDLISSIVDRIVFKKNDIDPERILNAGLDAVYKYLMG